MIGVIIGARKVGINPDNVATPIAASLGDLITLSLLAGISSTLFKYIGKVHSRVSAAQLLGKPPDRESCSVVERKHPQSWTC